MRRFYIDTETDGLLQSVSRMYVMVATDIDTGQTYEWLEGDTSWLELFKKDVSLLIGHNVIGYDLQVLKKLFDFDAPEHCTVVDTLLMSQILNYRRFGNDGHSLERWGQFLGHPKIEFNDWSKWTPEMSIYCRGDVTLGIKVYWYLMEEYKNLVAKSPLLREYVRSEHYVAEWCATANRLGWPFNQEKAKALMKVLEAELDKAYTALSSKLGMKCVAKDREKGEVIPKSPKWIKNGCYDAHTAGWFGVDPFSGIDDPELNEMPGHRMIKGPYSRVEFKELSLDSVQDVKLFLDRNGWEPTEWNWKEDPLTGQKVKASPKITEDSLEFLGGDGKLYTDFLTVKSRYGVMKTWLENVDENGMLHGECMTIGTPSMRARHQIIVNVPKVGSVYGAEMRALFETIPGWTFIGADSAGNQARGLAHYLGDPDFINILLNEDIHRYNAECIDRVLREMHIDWSAWIRQSPYFEEEKQAAIREGKSFDPEAVIFKRKRESAKRILYAFLFGASGGKLWSYIFEVIDDEKGRKFKPKFEKAVPGFKALKERLEHIFGKTSQFGDGYIPSLAGNRIYCDSFHKLLVYLLQAAEKITCSAALMLTVRGLRAAKIPYRPLIFYHDEIDFLVPNEFAEQASEIAVQAFRDGPKIYNVMIMDGGAKLGLNWAECH